MGHWIENTDAQSSKNVYLMIESILDNKDTHNLMIDCIYRNLNKSVAVEMKFSISTCVYIRFEEILIQTTIDKKLLSYLWLDNEVSLNKILAILCDVVGMKFEKKKMNMIELYEEKFLKRLNMFLTAYNDFGVICETCKMLSIIGLSNTAIIFNRYIFPKVMICLDDYKERSKVLYSIAESISKMLKNLKLKYSIIEVYIITVIVIFHAYLVLFFNEQKTNSSFCFVLSFWIWIWF